MKNANFKPGANRPAEIRASGEKELFIQWQDGHKSVYPFPYLRKNCRCAACVGESSGQSLIPPGETFDGIRPVDTALVGNYAVRFHWSDGHATGIYSFELLRSLCPCSECNA